MKGFNASVLATVFGLFAVSGSAQAAITVSSVVGGAPTGVELDNLDWLSLGTAGGLSPQSGVQINFKPNAKAVQGSVSGQYAAPYLSGGNGSGFGNPIGTNQPNGVDATTYITSGSTGATSGAAAEVVLPDNGGMGYRYFGLLWGSVDNYNTLSFYKNESFVGDLTGSDVFNSPVGDRGQNGTVYVNINSTDAFDTVVATSSSFAFEFDNIAFNQEAVGVPAPAAIGLLGLGLVGLGMATGGRRRLA
jgi:hypothetical protein